MNPLSKGFFNHAAKFSESIAFIIPQNKVIESVSNTWKVQFELDKSFGLYFNLKCFQKIVLYSMGSLTMFLAVCKFGLKLIQKTLFKISGFVKDHQLNITIVNAFICFLLVIMYPNFQMGKITN